MTEESIHTSFMLSVFDWCSRWRSTSKDVSLVFPFSKAFFYSTWKCVTDCQEGFFFLYMSRWTKCLFPANTERWANSDSCDTLAGLQSKASGSLSPNILFNYSLTLTRTIFILFGFFEIIYSNLFLCIFAQCYCIDCYLSVYSPFSSHCWCAFSCVLDASVWRGWTKAMCLVRSHTHGVSLYESREQQTIKCTKCALWVTDLPHHHQHLA